MPTDTSQNTFPLGTIALLLATLVLYLAMLGTISFTTGVGDASMGEALASFFVTVCLFVALAVLLVAAGMMGEMPRWAVWSAVVLVPFAGVATFAAIDMCSRHMRWAVVFPVLLPLAVALYAMGIRFATLRRGVPARTFSLTAWGFVLGLSVVACVLAATF